MDANHPARFMVALALLVDAIVGHLLFRSGFGDAGREPVAAATIGALLVRAIAVAVVVKPSSLSLQFARGIAAGMLIGMALIAFLYFLAANFESGVSAAESEWALLWGVGLLVAQLAVLMGCSWIDGKGLVESVAATAAGTFKFWLVFVLVITVTMTMGV